MLVFMASVQFNHIPMGSMTTIPNSISNKDSKNKFEKNFNSIDPIYLGQNE